MDKCEGPLTATEIKMLQDAALGLTAKESAVKNYKDVETVKTQRKRILIKLDANNMVNAVYIGLLEGIIK